MSDGGKRARSPGRSRISRKTIAQGRPDDPPVPVVLPRAFLLHADRGCGGHPAFPAPSLVRGREIQNQTSRKPAARSRSCGPRPTPSVIAREDGRSSIPEAPVSKSRGRSVLDTPAFAGYDDLLWS